MEPRQFEQVRDSAFATIAGTMMSVWGFGRTPGPHSYSLQYTSMLSGSGGRAVLGCQPD